MRPRWPRALCERALSSSASSSSARVSPQDMLLLLLATSGLLLPGIGEKVVTHATSAADVRSWVEEHCSAPGVVGFDTETRPSHRKGRPNPPAVIQLSTMHACLVAQVYVAPRHRLGRRGAWVESAREAREGADGVRHALTATLEDRSILKAGVGVDNDAIDLWQFWGLEVNGRVELAGVAERSRSLARLLATTTGVELSKPKALQASDWAAPLGERQVAYAAADAWAGRAIYERLSSLDASSFGLDAVAALLDAGERSCFELYAMRRARQAARAALADVAAQLGEEGLPHRLGSGEESHASARRGITALSGHARTVARSLADSKDTRLPVDSVLDAAPEIDEVSTLGREDRSGVVQQRK